MSNAMKDCSCEKCRSLCEGNPGWFSPGQIIPASKTLGLTLSEFFERFLIVEYWVDCEKGNTYVLAPRKTNQDGKTIAGFSDNFIDGSCRLLGDEGCILSYETRPIECAKCYGCSSPSEGYEREKIKDLWETHAGTDLIEKSSGYSKTPLP